MVPFLLVMYILGIVFLVLYLLTRTVLVSQLALSKLGVSLSKNTKLYSAFNLLSFVWMFIILLLFGVYDLYVATIESSIKPEIIGHLNRILESVAFFFLFLFASLSVVILIAGYASDVPVRNKPVNTMSSYWQSIFVFLFIILGIIGAVVGILT